MFGIFQNRREAGCLLAEKLIGYANASDALVLALPRGGVPVAAEIAAAFHLPLDALVVRKLGVPSHPELTMGAIASGGMRVLNRDIVEALRLPREMIARVEERELAELDRLERVYRDDRREPVIKDRVVLLVDDGIATGSTMLAAANAVETAGASKVVLAAPVIAYAAYAWMHAAGREVIHVLAPAEFFCVEHWYRDFDPPTDEEVRAILAEAHREPPNAAWSAGEWATGSAI